MKRLHDAGVQDWFKPFYRVTPIWENNRGEQFSYGDEVFTERTLDDVKTACSKMEGYECFRVELVTEVRILTPMGKGDEHTSSRQS